VTAWTGPAGWQVCQCLGLVEDVRSIWRASITVMAGEFRDLARWEGGGHGILWTYGGSKSW